MAKITVGVPVYNSSSLLAECLKCLVDQTFRDFEILIFDNASTDSTGDIAREFATRDPRIKYHRQPQNIGMFPNFASVMDACQTPYFCWRAYDDLSSLDWLERLYEALEANPSAQLAVARIATSLDGAEPILSYDLPKLTGNALIDIRNQLRHSNAACLYGLWRIETIKTIFHDVTSEYPTAWAGDHLMIFPILLNRSLVIVPEATFIVRDYSTVVRGYHRPKLQEMRELRRIYYRIALRHINALNLPWYQKQIVKYYAWLQLGKAIFMFRRVVMQTLRKPIYKLLGKG